MTDPADQERNDFRPVSYRDDPDRERPGRDYRDPEDEAANRGDFTDPRVAQPGEGAPRGEEAQEPSQEVVERPGQRPR